ncbi:recombinase family protein [Methylobrevis pamukkalensis]|uniref:DNA-invertase hin n=1 Tax=Methylobrevis pamukkalensis TaxID=1439726 RepID=A0A1E3GVF1_9HYPH|nr:recombinase family protein [Methylobrevis pamukkalensis]ODN68017.1 DNA-invertase hin [Methylobrevis pamukkalensis]
MREAPLKSQRCAIYTRKSTEHNLDLAFNSLDAQREACEAYIRSQAHEGWRLVPEPYDDGGLSGASLQHPALQALLDAVRQGGIDIIVVYKVDRLTRSLADFAKLVELFDAHGVSFVSITQSFNTTSSMGRLTLNVLLSFAQFEREVIGERVRDKIAASKRRGLWVGGPVPLGYRSQNKQLVVDDSEAALVRRIFRLYLDLGSVGAVVERLDAEGARTRKGHRFSVGPVAHLLKSRIYLGQIVWQGEIYGAAHTPLIDAETFAAVEAGLGADVVRRRGRASSRAFLLAGLLHDNAGHRMSPSHASKAGVRYRYYVSQALLQHRKAEAGSIKRVSAPDVEAAVVKAVGLDGAELRDRVVRITLHKDRLVIEMKDREDEAAHEPIVAPFTWQPQGRRKGIIHEPSSQQAAIDPDTSRTILAAIGRARRWMADLIHGTASTQEIADREGMGERNVRKLLPLACLSPDLVRAIVDCTAPAGLTISSLTAALPHDWAAQEQRFLKI